MRLLGVCISVGYVCLKALSLDGAKKYMLKTYIFLPPSLPLYLCFLSLPPVLPPSLPSVVPSLTEAIANSDTVSSSSALWGSF